MVREKENKCGERISDERVREKGRREREREGMSVCVCARIS